MKRHNQTSHDGCFVIIASRKFLNNLLPAREELHQLSVCDEEQDSLTLTKESDNALEDDNYCFESCDDQVMGGCATVQVMDEAVCDMVS